MVNSLDTYFPFSSVISPELILGISSLSPFSVLSGIGYCGKKEIIPLKKKDFESTVHICVFFGPNYTKYDQ